MIWVAGLAVVYLTLAAMVVLGLVRAAGRKMPPFEPDGPWQPAGTCVNAPLCPLPKNHPGQCRNDSGDGRGPNPRAAPPPSPGKNSEATPPTRAAAEETVTRRDT